jgi:Flp pilus assembly protein TadB
MDGLLSSPMFPIIAAALVFIVIAAIVVLMSRKAGDGEGDISDRLSQYVGAPTEESKDNAAAIAQRLDAVVSKSKSGSNIARDLARADLKLTVFEFVMIKIGCAVLGGLIGAFIGRASIEAQVISALVGFIVLSFAPNIYLSIRARQRVTAFNNQLGDTIGLMANSLRSGYSFLQSLDLVAREAPEPASSEFRRVVQEVGLGRTTEEALAGLLRRVPSDDLDLLITAVNIQHEVGGNLAQVLDTIGHTIRERVRIKGEIKTLTAQGRISAYVITGLPIGLAIFITMINPNYMAPIFTFGMPPQAWCCLPVTSLIFIGIGYYAIMKIIDIDV